MSGLSSSDILQYNTDPDRTYLQRVHLTFAWGAYRAFRTMEVRGNCFGLHAIRAALELVYDELPNEDGMTFLEMLAFGSADRHTCYDDENLEEEWLAELLVSAEILSIELE